MQIARRRRFQELELRLGIRGLIGSLVAMGLVALLLAIGAHRTTGGIAHMDRINRELPVLNRLFQALLNAETGQRGYLLTGRPEYLTPYNAGVAEVRYHLALLATRNDQALHPLDLVRMRDLVDMKLDELAQTVTLLERGEREAALRLVNEGPGKQHMDALRTMITVDLDALRAERRSLSRALMRDAGLTKIAMLGMLAVLVIFASLALVVVLAHARRLASAERQIRTVVNNVPALITQFDASRRIVLANAFAGRLYKTEPEALLGRTVGDIRGEAAEEELRPHMDRVLAGHPVEFESSAVIDGRRYHFQQRYVPDSSAEGQVQGFFSVTTDVSELKAAHERMAELAQTDSLTGLPNRRAFDSALPAAVARGSRSGAGVALLYLDIDHFKAINDHYGHAAGDAVLLEFARRLKTNVRISDMTARLAGDEFAVVLEGQSAQASAVVVADKIVEAMREPICLPNGILVPLGTSVGVAHAKAPDFTPADLLAAADAALYRAKQAGRNRWSV